MAIVSRPRDYSYCVMNCTLAVGLLLRSMDIA